MTRKIASVLFAASLAWTGSACEEEGDVTTLVGPVLDMIVDAKVAGGFPSLSVSDISFVNKSPSRLTLDLRFLDAVQSGAYQLFLVTLDGKRAIPAKGAYSTVRADSTRVSRDSVAVTITVADKGQASGTAGGPVNVTHRFVIDEAGLLPDSLDHFAYVVVAVQGSGAALEANAPAPLWFKYRNEQITKLPDTRAWLKGSAGFGRFVAGGQPYIFGAGGQGLGGFFQDRLVVNFTHLPRPPLGYAYRAWLVKADGTAKDLGPLLSPHPELASLETADGATPSVVVQETEIVRATVATDEAKLGARFHDFDLFLLTLELKSGGSERSPASSVGGPLPGGVLERRTK